MKLYLSSYRLGNNPGALVELVGSRARAGLLFNARDVFGDERLRNFPREAEELETLGFACEELDLRSFFGAFDDLRAHLDRFDLLWVVGGNAFVLARAMTAARLAEAADETIREEHLVYAGYSAGACVVAPDLEGVRLMDEPNVVPDGYPLDADPRTLDWVPWRIVPHWRSAHPESPLADLAVDDLTRRGLPFKALSDGQALIVQDEHVDLV